MIGLRGKQPGTGLRIGEKGTIDQRQRYGTAQREEKKSQTESAHVQQQRNADNGQNRPDAYTRPCGESHGHARKKSEHGVGF